MNISVVLISLRIVVNFESKLKSSFIIFSHLWEKNQSIILRLLFFSMASKKMEQKEKNSQNVDPDWAFCQTSLYLVSPLCYFFVFFNLLAVTKNRTRNPLQSTANPSWISTFFCLLFPMTFHHHNVNNLKRHRTILKFTGDDSGHSYCVKYTWHRSRKHNTIPNFSRKTTRIHIIIYLWTSLPFTQVTGLGQLKKWPIFFLSLAHYLLVFLSIRIDFKLKSLNRPIDFSSVIHVVIPESWTNGLWKACSTDRERGFLGLYQRGFQQGKCLGDPIIQ